jgi:Zn ribbon nucleic-acid-binding protein
MSVPHGLFWMALRKLIDYSASWATGQVLSVITGCPTCQQKDAVRIANKSLNPLECSNCHHQHLQFTNACDLTLTKSTGAIGHAEFAHVARQVHWHTTGWLIKRKEWCALPYNILCQDLMGRSIVLQTTLTDFERGTLLSTDVEAGNVEFNEQTKLWQPKSIIITRQTAWHDTGRGHWNSARAAACDVILMTEHKDILAKDRRVVSLDFGMELPAAESEQRA